MNQWQKKFAEKVDTIRKASSQQFEQVVEDVVMPTFDQFRNFTTQHGLRATAPIVKVGIRSFKFSVTENAYALITFRHTGIEHCEVECEYFIPGVEKLPTTDARVELSKPGTEWVQGVFETSLDQFMDRYLKSVAKRNTAGKELVNA